MKSSALLASLFLTSCAGIRSTVGTVLNADLTGTPAPALDAGTWVGPAPELDGDWYLVAFLLPT